MPLNSGSRCGDRTFECLLELDVLGLCDCRRDGEDKDRASVGSSALPSVLLSTIDGLSVSLKSDFRLSSVLRSESIG